MCWWITPILRDKFNGTMIVNGGYGAHSGHGRSHAEKLISSRSG
jgi:hypothetical protein